MFAMGPEKKSKNSNNSTFPNLKFYSTKAKIHVALVLGVRKQRKSGAVVQADIQLEYGWDVRILGGNIGNCSRFCST